MLEMLPRTETPGEGGTCCIVECRAIQYRNNSSCALWHLFRIKSGRKADGVNSPTDWREQPDQHSQSRAATIA